MSVIPSPFCLPFLNTYPSPQLLQSPTTYPKHGLLDLIVSATGFKSDSVNLDIEAHLRCSTDRKEGELRTLVVGSIAKAIQGTSIKGGA